MKFNITYHILVPSFLILDTTNFLNYEFNSILTNMSQNASSIFLEKMFSLNQILEIILIIILLLSVIFLLGFYHIFKIKQRKKYIKYYKDKIELNNKKIKNIYSHFSDIYFKTDNKGEIIEVSPSVLDITGYEASFYINKHISLVFAYDEEWEDISEAMKKKETVKDRLYSTKTKNGNPTICSLTIKVHKNETGSIMGYEGILKDFSQRHSAQKKFDNLENSFTNSLAFSNTGTTKFRSSLNLFHIDFSLCKLLGYTELKKYLKTSQFFELIHEKELNSVQEGFNQLLNKSNSSFIINCRIKNIDGNYLWFSNKFEANKFKNNGQITEIVGIHTLIQTQKKLESSILDYRRKLYSIYNTTKIMLFVIKEDLSILEINDTATKHFNKPKTEIIGKTIDDILCSNDSKDFSKKITTLIQNSFNKKNNTLNQEISCTQNKNKKHLNVSTNVFIEEENLNCLVIVEDISKRKSFELQTQNKLNILKQKEKETLSLLNKIIDEIRNPINGILTESSSNEYLNSIENYKKSETNIRKNAHKILDLIESINNLAEQNPKKETINIERFNVSEYLNILHLNLKKHTIPDDVTIICNISNDSINSYITADPEKFKNLFTNIILSLLKTLSPNNIEIGASYINETHAFYIMTNPLNQEIKIADLQPEILIELAENINAKFDIEINDLNQVKCKFLIKDTEPKSNPETIVNSKLQKAKILIVEDEEYNIYYLKQILKMAGYNTVVAEDGQKAIDIAKQDKQIDLILMDIRLPGIDGLEASKRIKEFLPNIPIIAQTAFNLNSKEDQDMEKYCDDYIQKPILSQTLYEKIENILKN